MNSVDPQNDNFLYAKLTSYSAVDGEKSLKSRMERAPRKTAKWVRWILSQVPASSEKRYSANHVVFDDEQLKRFLDALRCSEVFSEPNMLGDGGVELQCALEEVIRAENEKIALQMIRDGYSATMTDLQAARQCNLPEVLEGLLDIIPVSQELLDTLLLDACEKGHIKLADTLLQKGADINAKTPDSRNSSTLHLACNNSHTELAIMLAKRGAEVSEDILKKACSVLPKSATSWLIRCQEGMNLHSAYDAGCAGLIEDLIRYRVDVKKDKVSKEMIQYAAGAGLVDILDFLLYKIPKKERQQYLDGECCRASPLNEALKKKQVPAAKFLISKGARLSWSDIKRNSWEHTQDYWPTPFYTAADEGLVEIMEIMASKIPLEKREEFLNQGGIQDPKIISDTAVSPLIAALLSRHEAAANWLMNAGAYGDMTKPGWTKELLYHSAGAGLLEILKSISSKMPEEKWLEYLHGKPQALGKALNNKHKAVAVWLLEAGAKIVLEKDRLSQLEMAANAGFEEVVKLILLQISPEEIRNHNGTNCFHGAFTDLVLKLRHAGVVKQLIQAGTAANAFEKFMEYKMREPLELWSWVIAEGDVELIGLILTITSPENTKMLLNGGEEPSLIIALNNSRLNIAKTLIDRGAKITDNALTAACKNGHEDMAIQFLDAGANPLYGHSPDGKTALTYARDKGLKRVETKIIKTLLAEFVKNSQCAEDLIKMLDNCSDPQEFFNVEKRGDVQLCDRQIVLDDKSSFFVNSMLLAARSDYFKSLWHYESGENGFQKNTTPKTELLEVDSHDFEQWLQFQYTGKIEVTHRNFKALATLAGRFLDEKLQKRLRKWILNHPECGHWKERLSLGTRFA